MLQLEEFGRDSFLSSIYILLLGLHFKFSYSKGMDAFLMFIINWLYVFCVIFLHLIRIQHELEVSTKQPIFVDSSISDTIRTCIVLGNHRAALKVKTEFKVRYHLSEFTTV